MYSQLMISKIILAFYERKGQLEKEYKSHKNDK